MKPTKAIWDPAWGIIVSLENGKDYALAKPYDLILGLRMVLLSRVTGRTPEGALDFTEEPGAGDPLVIVPAELAARSGIGPGRFMASEEPSVLALGVLAWHNTLDPLGINLPPYRKELPIPPPPAAEKIIRGMKWRNRYPDGASSPLR